MNNTVKPSKKQLEFMSWEFGAFFHFGIRTFYEGHKDWDGKPMDLAAFNPSGLSCEQWISTIKNAGAKYAILVAKHHDGFANWPSAYTDYSVKNTPWKDGRGDVVGEFVSACRKYGIKTGLYYSPADHDMSERTDKEHDDFFINQISELLTNYGKIDYLWFDGCGSEGHRYDEARIIKVIRTLQPDILIFNMWDPDTRWVGNEAGVAPYPCSNIVDSLDFSVLTDKAENLSSKMFLPAECDSMIRSDSWFYSDSNADHLKSLDELIGLYYYSVGRGANLLINIGPDRRGLLPDIDVDRITEFGGAVKNRFKSPIAKFSDFKKNKDSYILTFEKPALLNHVVLSEDLTDGQNITSFNVSVKPYPNGGEISVFDGKTIGHKCIVSFPSILATELDVEITGYDHTAVISGINVFYVR